MNASVISIERAAEEYRLFHDQDFQARRARQEAAEHRQRIEQSIAAGRPTGLVVEFDPLPWLPGREARCN